ncbi:MBL fold metallo-hydrolase [Spirulina sp. CS-785/01]|uniref:MBL fold metallo-hydrolase n=1 Tax=Spirulina sp. CS-785/01 TaxID=3021716 RepID=UPI003FA7384F
MKRRKLLQYAGVSLLTASGLLTTRQRVSQAQTGGVTIKYLGHTCFLFSGEGKRVLVNPFRTLGCTAGYRTPSVSADLVLTSSWLFDEGVPSVVPNVSQDKVIREAGSYLIDGKEFQGISIPHDRQGGRRFGDNVAWKWTQGGVDILHLGGAAAPIEIEHKILMGRPDVALVPVGGGPKAYTPQEALQAIETLRPRIVIPTHYRTQAADATNCDIQPLEDFLTLASYPVDRVGSDTLAVTVGSLSSETVIKVLNYPF